MGSHAGVGFAFAVRGSMYASPDTGVEKTLAIESRRQSCSKSRCSCFVNIEILLFIYNFNFLISELIYLRLPSY